MQTVSARSEAGAVGDQRPVKGEFGLCERRQLCMVAKGVKEADQSDDMPMLTAEEKDRRQEGAGGDENDSD